MSTSELRDLSAFRVEATQLHELELESISTIDRPHLDALALTSRGFRQRVASVARTELARRAVVVARMRALGA